jgi:hypothetical protein
VLKELETLVTPDTLFRRYRELVASKWNYGHRRGPGRPRVMKTIVDLILRVVVDNLSWGYTRIRGAPANLGHQVGRGTIGNILKENGSEPAPERDGHTRWSTFDPHTSHHSQFNRYSPLVRQCGVSAGEPSVNLTDYCKRDSFWRHGP